MATPYISSPSENTTSCCRRPPALSPPASCAAAPRRPLSEPCFPLPLALTGSLSAPTWSFSRSRARSATPCSPPRSEERRVGKVDRYRQSQHQFGLSSHQQRSDVTV